MEADQQDLTNKTVGQYELDGGLGRPGAQGRAYRATHIWTKEPAAIKILAEPTEEQIRRFTREAEILGSLDHPNIVSIQDFGYDEPYHVFYIATDLVEGVPLANVLESRQGGLSLEETLGIAEQVTWALAHAHARGIYHGDLKPSNILIGCQEIDSLIGKKVWLIDFGFAVWGMRPDKGAHAAYGTYSYWAPEQVRGGEFTRQTELYQFGVVLYEMLTGKVPFHHQDPTEVLRQIVEAPALPPSRLTLTLPSSTDEFFQKALDKNGQDRFGTAEQMLEAFRQSVPGGQRLASGDIPKGAQLPHPQFVTASDGVQIAFTVKGSGYPLIYPPPWVSHQGVQWTDVRLRSFFEKLTEKSRLISYDRRGCGVSSRQVKDLSWEAQLRDLAAVIDHLHLNRFAFLAMSGAGPLAISYAADHPQQVSKLILYGTYANGRAILPSQNLQQSFLGLVRDSWGDAARFFTELFIPRADEEQKNWLAMYQRASSSAEQAAQFLSQIYELDITELAKKVQCPTLVIHRYSDKAIPFRLGEQLISFIPNATLQRLEGNIHLPWLGDSQSILNAILGFLYENTD